MRIEVTKKNILPAAKVCADIVPTNLHLPSLAGGVLSAGEDRAYLYSTNLEVFCTVSFPAEIFDSGQVVVPLKKLASLVALLDGDPVIELSTEAEFQTRIRSGGTDTLLAGFDPESYPAPPENAALTTVEIPAKKFLNAVRRVAYAVSKDPSRPAYQGLWFEKMGGELSMTCSDDYKLATESVLEGQEQGVNFQVILPLQACLLVTKWIDENDEDFVKVEIGGNYARFIKDPAVVVTRVFDLKIPDWRKVIPTDMEVRVKAPVEKVTAAVERIAVVGVDPSKELFPVEINILPDQIVMKSSTLNGTAKETLEDVETNGSTMIYLNLPFLLQTLKAVGKGNVEMLISGKAAPVVFRFDAAPEHLALILPIYWKIGRG